MEATEPGRLSTQLEGSAVLGTLETLQRHQEKLCHLFLSKIIITHKQDTLATIGQARADRQAFEVIDRDAQLPEI